MTVHAMEEMAEDDLDILDIEEAVLNGRVVRSRRRDPLGPKYTVEGLASDGEKLVGVRPIPFNISLFSHYCL